MLRLIVAILVFGSLSWAAPSLAATVIIVRPANASVGIAETVVRMRGELLSAGFAVEVVDATRATEQTGRASRDSLEGLAAQRAADAVVAIVGATEPNSVEVWVIDKVTGKSVVRSLPFEAKSGRASETLAIRAIELLRSSFLEIDLIAKGRRDESEPAPPPAVIRFVEVDRPSRRAERFGVELGGAGVIGLGGLGLALLPILAFDWAPGPSSVVQLALAGLGTRPTVETALGSAQVAQAFATLGGAWRLRVGRGVRPFLSFSAGVLHTSVEGRAADTSNQGRDSDAWSLLLDGSMGTTLALRDRLYLSLATHVQMAEPYPAIHFLDTVVATSVRPNLVVTLAVGAWL